MNKNAFAYITGCLGAAAALIGLTNVFPAIGCTLAVLLGLYGLYVLSLGRKEGDSARVMAGIGLTPALAVATFLLMQNGLFILAPFVAGAALMTAISLGRRIYP